MAFPKKTTADVPPSVAPEFAKASRPTAVSDATATGYATTKPMQKGLKSKSQFGLPKSGSMKAMKMRDTDKDKM